MGLVTCPDCGRMISDSAPRCLHCGRPMARGRTQHRLDGLWKWWTGLTQRRRFVIAAAVAALMVLPAVVGRITRKEVTVYGADGVQQFTVRGGGPDRAEAFAACKEFVRDQLRAPTTAQFSEFDPSSVQVDPAGRFRVRLTVDAQNTFGAVLRSTFDCSLRFEGEEPSLISLAELP